MSQLHQANVDAETKTSQAKHPFGGTKLPVAVLGATGQVGQRFIELLSNHPWFELGSLCASPESEGRPYAECLRGSLEGAIRSDILERPVTSMQSELSESLVFSALHPDVAELHELRLVRAGHKLVTNAKNLRMHDRVPLLVPEVNPQHLELIESQAWGDGWIVANPNCSTAGLVLALKPLADAFGLKSAQVTTMQALSGAGHAGPSALQMTGNLVPFISGEEDKLETEVSKLLGTCGDSVQPHSVKLSAQCNRVNVIDGHTSCVSVKLDRAPSGPDLVEAARELWRSFSAEPQERSLPSAPARPLVVLDTVDGPQPRLHRDLENGMATVIGRVQPCGVNDLKFVTLSHNTLRGAAGGAVLCAELLASRGALSRA